MRIMSEQSAVPANLQRRNPRDTLARKVLASNQYFESLKKSISNPDHFPSILRMDVVMKTMALEWSRQ